jgi:hypothetical protein
VVRTVPHDQSRPGATGRAPCRSAKGRQGRRRREPHSGQRFAATSIPLLVVLRDGQEVDRVVGAVPPASLEARLAPLLAGS